MLRETGVAAGARAEAYAALVALGYKPVEVNRLLQGVEQDGAGHRGAHSPRIAGGGPVGFRG